MNSSLENLIDKWRTRGAIAPSSIFLVSKMIAKIDYSSDLELLQLGFGQGVFTKEILKKMTLASRLTIFEVDANCRQFKIDDPRINYIEDSAENITKYFAEKKFDHIISTLPFGSLPNKISTNIFEQIKKHLKTGGKFLQFQYSLVSKKDIYNLFDQEPEIDFELLNLPPAFIYETQNKNDN